MSQQAPARRRARRAIWILGATASVVAALAAVAIAKTFTLTVAKNAPVTNITDAKAKTVHENIAVNKGFAVYTLSGDSKQHPECTKANGCLGFWPPVTVASSHHLTKAARISGRLGTWRRDGFIQLTLNGHPLYHFSADHEKRAANGNGIVSFGGTWHVVKAGKSHAGSGASSGSSSMGATPYPYPSY